MQYVNEILIGTNSDKVAAALADPAQSKQYYYGFEIYSDWQVGSRYEYRIGDQVCITGQILELVPGSKMVMSFNGLWNPKVAEHQETKVTWELEQTGENTYLKMTHDGLVEGSYAATALPRGWVNIISSLKTYLETGKPMNIDISTMMN